MKDFKFSDFLTACFSIFIDQLLYGPQDRDTLTGQSIKHSNSKVTIQFILLIVAAWI